MIRAITAGRAGIIGNPTDGYGGTLVACSIRNKAVTTIEEHDELLIENTFGKTTLRWKNDFDNQNDYFDIVRCVLRQLKAYNLKAKISSTSTIPVQAGLAGSTAILSSVLAAVLAFTGQKMHRYEIAELNRDIELNYLKCQCGYQDAYMTTFGGLNLVDFRGKAYYKPWKQEQYATVENLSQYVDYLPVVIAHTGVKHHSGQFHRPLRERWLEGDPAVVQGYEEIMNLAREGKKAILDQDWDNLAYLMNENQRIQDSLADSGEQNRIMIDIARKNGGMAAKLAGAGGGGTIIVLTLEPDRVKNALIAAGTDSFIDLDPKAPGITVEEVADQADKQDTTNTNS